MKKTQFRIGLLTACLIGANSAFYDIASAQSCGAETCDSTSCKCSKKHCDDSGLLEVINSAASNFEAGLSNMISDGQKRKAKPSCECSKCSAAASEHSHAVPMTPPTVHEKEHVHSPTPHSHTQHSAAPVNPIYSTVPSPKPLRMPPVPAPIPAPIPEAQDNPFRDDTTRNHRLVPTRPASLLRLNNGLPIEYDPQARSYKPTRSSMVSQAAIKSVSDLPHGLATTSSTRRAASTFSDRASSDRVAANQLHSELPSESELESGAFAVAQAEHAAPTVVPASITLPLRNFRELQTSSSTNSTNSNHSPAAVPSEMYVNPLRAQ